MAVVRKKQDDKYLKVLRELVSMNGNKQCFDCNQKGPTYVNMTIGSFVCTRCSGILRGLTPPHRVKSISMAVFTTEEIDFIKAHGNDLCAKTWLALWDPKRNHKHDHRELMIDKYERKRYYLEPASPLKSITNTAQLSQSQKQQINGVSVTTNGVNKSTEENSFNSLWSTNGLINGNNSATTALTNGSRTQNSYNKLDLFSSNDNNNLFNSSKNSNNSHMTQQTNGISLNNGINLSASSDNVLSNGFHSIGSNDKQRQQQQQQQNVITKNGLNLQQMSPSSSSLSSAASNFENSSNLFTPDSDFVADFGSANIFNAMNNKLATTNGNSMKPIHLNGPTTNGNHTNGFDKMTNGKRSNGNSSNGITNGFDDVENDNFADFEHNTIYNAAAIQNQNNNCYYNNNANNNNNNNNNVSNNYVNVGSFGYSNSNTFTYSSNGNTNANAQWSVWQQFPWPYIQSEQNRWSLPMSVSSTSNSLKSSGTFNSNSSINSTPSIDRYAALKDLDEQLREIKEKETQNTQTSANSVTANPFNVSNGQSVSAVQPNPFQTTSNHQILWPSDQTTNLFGNNVNGSQQSMYHPFNNGNNIFNGNGNGNGNANQYQNKLAGHNAFNGSITIPNGFPQHQHQQQPNPFAAPVLNATTNPFL